MIFIKTCHSMTTTETVGLLTASKTGNRRFCKILINLTFLLYWNFLYFLSIKSGLRALSDLPNSSNYKVWFSADLIYQVSFLSFCFVTIFDNKKQLTFVCKIGLSQTWSTIFVFFATKRRNTIKQKISHKMIYHRKK